MTKKKFSLLSHAEVVAESSRKVESPLRGEVSKYDEQFVSTSVMNDDGTLSVAHELKRVPRKQRFSGLTCNDFSMHNLQLSGAVSSLKNSVISRENLDASDRIDGVIKNIEVQ